MPETEEVQEVKRSVRIVVSSLSNERRTINMGECDEETIKKIYALIDSAFQTVRVSQALTLSGTDGPAITFANLDNIAFVEVQID